MRFSEIIPRIRSTIEEYIRILKIAEKPSKSELYETLKICGIALLIIGVVGFLIQVVFRVIRGI
ncbi:MAG: protein translocase SEC61 complex subunit gamma [Candidatus Parvarchaeota archaeon]|nr:protein translocase SEC61 complex subunit gamma [Candidatus Jingweiarchaeum tengchongense]MCW1297754.1 protein translocase SEC61 complex subunit gamma [Candidatus Jingweiarchaeum tengchongense]MCW1299764.1 protein translocase SEC61 complex subunit gamma [Candidatus Jingweiarchaeum tengchongense]MCW1304265.1 protein translocase SEC61 complex subunit gamma [Candidatus Jingweiarchaeum tengchongense]MCW1305293.1 protein translocase SEC61 complex subunit gamma [Candidatus Jingweiarchaeum tengchon